MDCYPCKQISFLLSGASFRTLQARRMMFFIWILRMWAASGRSWTSCTRRIWILTRTTSKSCWTQPSVCRFRTSSICVTPFWSQPPSTSLQACPVTAPSPCRAPWLPTRTVSSMKTTRLTCCPSAPRASSRAGPWTSHTLMHQPQLAFIPPWPKPPNKLPTRSMAAAQNCLSNSPTVTTSSETCTVSSTINMPAVPVTSAWPSSLSPSAPPRTFTPRIASPVQSVTPTVSWSPPSTCLPTSWPSLWVKMPQTPRPTTPASSLPGRWGSRRPFTLRSSTS